MRTHLLAITAVAAAVLAATGAHAGDSTWRSTPGSGDFNDFFNWTQGVPTGTAFFGASNVTSLSITSLLLPDTTTTVGGFTFNAGAPAYTFTVENPFSLTFNGAGINGGNVTIINNFGLNFVGSSSAGRAVIINNGMAKFMNTSTASNATITNSLFLQFSNSSTGGNATITTTGLAVTQFADNSTAGLARLITDAGGSVDFSINTGANLTAGSIAGAGTYFLGSNALTVGGNNLSTTVSGVIDGVGGSLIKTGTGTMTLSGDNTYTGATTVKAGALIVDGSIASSRLTTVNSGALLLGSGTVGSTTINAGGFLVPGTMTVAGNLALQSGAFYVVQINPTTASTTNVSGTASLAGTVAAFFAPGSYLPRNYTILTAAGGLTGTFDALATFGLPPAFGGSLSYTGNIAVLNLFAQLVPERTPPTPLTPVPPIPGLPPTADQPPAPPPFTVNQLNVGHAIDNFFNNGGALPPAFVSLFGLTGSNLTSALSQLSGEAATGAQKVAFQLTDQFLNVMLDPFVDGRSGVGGADHPALGFAPERETMPPDIALAYASVLKAAPAPAPIYEPRWTVWGAGYGGSNRTTGDLAVIGSHDLSARTAGGAAGLDYHLTSDTVAGFALAGGGTDWSLSQGLGGGKSDAFQAGIYGATKYGPAYLAAAFAFANHWMSTTRVAVGDHLTADFDAQSYGGRLEGGYRFATPYGGITPYAAIQAQFFHTEGFTETDAIANGFGLAFGSRDATDHKSELGARFDRVLAVYSNAVLALRGRVAWAHDWVSDPTLVPVFQALPGASFIVNGVIPAHNSALASAGAELRLANGITLLGKFDGEFASHSSTYAGTGTLRYRW
jgi:autotransporter-associated beta strand protein